MNMYFRNGREIHFFSYISVNIIHLVIGILFKYFRNLCLTWEKAFTSFVCDRDLGP